MRWPWGASRAGSPAMNLAYKAIKPVFGWIGDKAKWLWDKTIKPPFQDQARCKPRRRSFQAGKGQYQEAVGSASEYCQTPGEVLSSTSTTTESSHCGTRLHPSPELTSSRSWAPRDSIPAASCPATLLVVMIALSPLAVVKPSCGRSRRAQSARTASTHGMLLPVQAVLAVFSVPSPMECQRSRTAASSAGCRTRRATQGSSFPARSTTSTLARFSSRPRASSPTPCRRS